LLFVSMGCSHSTPDVRQDGDAAQLQADSVQSTKKAVAPRKIKQMSMSHRYRIRKTLGRGSYSRVFLAERDENQLVAIKAIHKDRLKPSELESVLTEAAVLASLEHPNVIQYIEHFEDHHKFYIVTEYLAGGELFDRIVQKEYYNENDVRTVMRTLLKTVKYCHDLGIVHRDIKPENILLVDSKDDSSIKLADFGFAKKVDFGGFNSLQTACGTPGYVAPEIITCDTYDKRVDIWSLGVVAYIMLCGYPPFRSDDRKNLYRMIRNAQYVFDSPWWDTVSDEAKDFVSKMLVANPSERSSIEDLLEHPFIHSTEDRDITPCLKELKSWNAKRKLALLRNTWKAAVRFKIAGMGATTKNRSKKTVQQVGKVVKTLNPIRPTKSGREEMPEPESSTPPNASALTRE